MPKFNRFVPKFGKDSEFERLYFKITCFKLVFIRTYCKYIF